jgi:predicted regulator of Ras-like GTPase activity (Roadblock/LC7/MglB family)
VLHLDIYFFIIILVLFILFFVLVKLFFNYLKKRKAQKKHDTDSSYFLKEGELLSALQQAPRDSHGNVNINSVVEQIIKSKNDGREETDKDISSQVEFLSRSKNSLTNGKMEGKDTAPGKNQKNNSQEEQRMFLLEDIVKELKLSDSEHLEERNNNREKTSHDTSFDNNKESSPLLIEKSRNGNEATKKEHISTLKDVLNEFIKLKGVKTVCLIERDGTVIESVSTKFTNFNFLSTHASNLINTSVLLGKEQEKGSLTMMITEFKKGFIIGSVISEERIVIIDADEEAILGMIRYLIIKHRKTLATK